jgi:transposase
MGEWGTGAGRVATANLPAVVTSAMGTLTEQEANAIYEQGREAVVFALMRLARDRADLAQQLGRQQGAKASTPSGMVAVYEKPSVKKRGKKPGREEGHPGVRRAPPVRIDRREEHKLDHCGRCGTELRPESTRTRVRIIEDIPEVEPVVTEHTIHRSYCSHCKEIVEPIVPDALPGSTIGHHLVALTAWLHYGLGQTLSQIVAVLNFHLRFQISEGGLVQMWGRLQEILYTWYEQIGEQAKKAGVLHADETGWRVAGVTHWLWCFTTQAVTYYMIDRSRGENALKKFFTEAFQGTLITDFWGAYKRVKAAFRQKCLAHLFRELEKVSAGAQSLAGVAAVLQETQAVAQGHVASAPSRGRLAGAVRLAAGAV